MLRSRITDDEVLEKPFNKEQLKRLLAYLKPYRGKVIVTVILMFVAAFLGLLGPYILQIAIDNYMEQADYAGLTVLALIFLAIDGVVMLCTRQRIRTMSEVGQKTLFRLRQDLFNHIQKLSFHFYDNRPAGKILVRIINDVNSLSNLLTNGIVNVMVDVATIFIVLGLMLSMDVRLTLITMIAMPLMIAVIISLRKIIRRRWQEVRKKSSNMNAYLHESLAGMRVIQAFAREPETNAIYNELSKDIRTSWMNAIKVNNLMGPSSDIISTIAVILVYWFGVSLIDTGTVTVGVLVAFSAYVGRFWQPVNNIMSFYNSILIAMASTERIFELMDTPPDIVDREDAIEMPKIEGHVTFENLTFYYEPEKPVLTNVNFHVKAGETIALVGPTGAGKTTIVNLLSLLWTS
jgi:ATP-binding cassette subfamily B multidrug efflux pump